MSEVNHKPSLSNLGLQIALQYNILFSITYACINCAVVIEKANYYDKLMPAGLLAVWAVMEPFRLYFGFQGNLKETVPDTATFLLMGLFPQCALVAYLAFFQPILYPIDYILGALMLLFLVSTSIPVICMTDNVIMRYVVAALHWTGLDWTDFLCYHLLLYVTIS